MDGWITIGTKIDNKTFDAQIKSLEDTLEGLEDELKIAMKDADFPDEEIKKYQVEIEKTKNKIIGLQKQQLNLNNSVKETGKSFDFNLKKVGKLALGIFSVRSAYMLVRQATNQLASENEQIGLKISAIKGSLTNLLAPAITWIVDKVYQLLGYLNVITKEFLGVDLFAKTDKSAKSSVKSAKKLQKTLAGFDEMNVINNTSSEGGVGGAKQKEIEPPIVSTKWTKVVKDYKKMWDDILEIDQNEARQLLIKSDKNWGEFKAGIFDTTQGIVKIFNGLIKGDFKQAGEGLIQLLQGLISIVIGLVKGLVKSVLDFFKNMWSGIKNTAIQVWDIIKDKVKSVWTGIKNTISSAVDKIKGFFNSIKTTASNVWDGIKNSLKAPINVMIGWVNKLIQGLNKISIKIPDWVPAYGGKSWGFNIKTIPKLAQGGIVNNPSRGVNMGSYVAGEKGAEAVIPLTDDTLQRLANMIPITINLTNSMNGRVISRELQKINAENSFANNW